ncbi:MAG: VOC family protein [Endozoicomonas sp.]
MSSYNIHIPTLAPELGTIKQIAFIVEDIDQAIDHWHQEYGVGPFIVTRDASPLKGARYRGEPGKPVLLDLAFADMGDLQLELIAQKNAVPSMYKEVFDRGQKGLQHYGTFVTDFEKARKFAEAQGMKPVIEVGVKGLARMNYLEARDFSRNIFASDEQSFMKTPEGYGIVLEVIEDNGLTKPIFDNMARIASSIPEGQRVKEFDYDALIPKGAMLAGLGRFLVKKLLQRA